jgi:NaMN:DMB phosphoribosyltransferase
VAGGADTGAAAVVVAEAGTVVETVVDTETATEPKRTADNRKRIYL